jgi:hypothetical protein
LTLFLPETYSLEKALITENLSCLITYFTSSGQKNSILFQEDSLVTQRINFGKKLSDSNRQVAEFDRLWHTYTHPMETQANNLSESGSLDGITGITGISSEIANTWGSIKNAIIGSSVAVFFGLAILLFSLLATTSPKAAETATVSAHVNYYLPYPGILPDSPLYRLKAARDIISTWIIFDLEKKAEKELFLADKRINAAVALIEGGKSSLGLTTATKAEKYLEQATNRAVSLRKAGKDTKSILGKLALAIQKHNQILTDIKKAMTGEQGASIDRIVEVNNNLLRSISEAL